MKFKHMRGRHNKDGTIERIKAPILAAFASKDIELDNYFVKKKISFYLLLNQ